LGVLMRGSGVSPALHLGLLAPVLIAALVIVAAPMAVTPARPHAATTTKRLALPTLATLGLVAFGLGAGMTEGAARAWSIIYLRDSFDVAPWVQSLALPALVAAMACGRLVADRVQDRIETVLLARILAALAVLGLATVAVAPNAGIGLAGFVLLGLGICILYPLMLSAAGRIGDRPASQNVAAVTLVFQLVNLGAPALIGLVAQMFGVRFAFVMLIPLLVLTFISAGQLRTKRAAGF